MTRRIAILLSACVAWQLVADRPLALAQALSPAQSDSDSQEVRRQLEHWLAELDADQYVRRRKALEKLKELASKPELRELLAGEFQRVLLKTDTSFEVRWHLERLLRDLPEVEPEPAPEVSAEQIERLIDRLDDDSYGVRLGAKRRLEWLAGNPKQAGQVLLAMKGRLAEANVAPDTRRLLEPVWELVWERWLLTDPAQWELPAATDAAIAGWAGDLARSAPKDAAPGPWHVHTTARRELLFLLVREEYLPRVKRALEDRLAAGNLGPDAEGRVKKLLELIHPAMVAEYWRGRQNLNQQHLLVDVPSLGTGAQRPSHFDRINEEVAHCVSGNTLSPGDYPVGVAVPHPLRYDACFHLVNLPTPRRRLAYPVYVKLTDQAKRLEALTKRTTARWLKAKQPLTDAEFAMTATLDMAEISRFAGEFFHLVDDVERMPQGHYGLGLWSSHHGALCECLVREGTHEAIPGLTRAIQKGRILAPKAGRPYRLDWIAALRIAVRDPWPEVDSWLAERIDCDDTLVFEQPDGAQVGATAAAMLLGRHEHSPGAFGLKTADNGIINKLGVAGYRFPSEEVRQKVKRWWAEKQREKAANDSA